MSELTPCNYCTYKKMKAEAKAKGQRIRLINSKKIPGWKAVKSEGKEIAWFMEMSDRCVC